MKTGQKEHCGTDEVLRGTGLWINIHGKNSIPKPIINSFSTLSPGFHTQITLRKVKVERKTEHLGFCTSNYKVDIL